MDMVTELVKNINQWRLIDVKPRLRVSQYVGVVVKRCCHPQSPNLHITSGKNRWIEKKVLKQENYVRAIQCQCPRMSLMIANFKKILARILRNVITLAIRSLPHSVEDHWDTTTDFFSNIGPPAQADMTLFRNEPGVSLGVIKAS